ncbi:hypothetical protein F511_10940 [Dorcoceras hygrometricum]|uniref:Uncharacterized protein n=1 Tax=Dorcoceras hygrometricum TaxID=472368 RepID=A0A2Z7BKM3_9LAMI|nr:hypothetical protein F511_10940 [Dorcoceras hygrometricum]
MLRLVPAGGIACVCLLVVQPKQMSTRVNIPVARGGNVVVLLLRLDVQLREIFATVVYVWCYCSLQLVIARGSYRLELMTSVERRRLNYLQRCVLRLRLVPAERSIVRYILRLDDQPMVGISILRPCFVVVVAQKYKGERRYRTLISLLGSLATMRRVVNYHSSWARQRQVELFDASGNPGSTAGRGFNPAGGAPGGG